MLYNIKMGKSKQMTKERKEKIHLIILGEHKNNKKRGCISGHTLFQYSEVY